MLASGVALCLARMAAALVDLLVMLAVSSKNVSGSRGKEANGGLVLTGEVGQAGRVSG